MLKTDPNVISHNAVTPHRAIVSIAVVIGLTIGVIPYLVFARHIGWAGFYSAVALVIAIFNLRSFKTIATKHPGTLEIVLGGWNAIYTGSIISLASLFFHMIGYWAWRGVRGLTTVFEVAMVSSAQKWGFWCAIVMGGFLAFSAVMGNSRDIAAKLYPPTAGTQSPYLSLVMEVRTLSLLALAGVAAVAVPFFLFEPGRWPFSTVLSLALFYPSLAIENQGRKTAKPQKAKGVEAIAKLLKHAGFQITASPRTGRADVDPFMKSVDLLAQSPERNLVIEVKTRHQTEAPVEWESAALLRTAASAMQDALSGDDAKKPVQPLLVVVARKIAASCIEFSKIENFPLRQIEDEAVIDQVIKENDSEALRTMAERYLGVAPVGPPIIVNTVGGTK